MPRPRIGPSAYADLIPFLDRALAATITLDCASEADAIRTNQRLNQFRVLLRSGGYCPYDGLIFRRRGSTLVLEQRGLPAIRVRDAQGQEIPLAEFEPRAATQEELEEMLRGPVTVRPEIQADYEKWLADQKRLHVIDPTKPLVDDE